MLGFLYKLSLLGQFLSKLSWEKIAQIAVFFLVLFSAWLAYVTRDDISRMLIAGKYEKTVPLQKLSKRTIEELDSTINKFDAISAISINSIDFRTNTRQIVYFSTNNRNLREIYNRYEVEGIIHPLFGNNTEINKRIIELINGEFICSKYIPILGGISVPESKEYIDTVCSSSIPPYYGKIVGTINIYLKREPSKEEIDQVRFLSKSLSAFVYSKELK